MMTQNADKKREQIQMFCMDDMVPQDHLLRIIDKAIDRSFIYDLVVDKYSTDFAYPICFLTMRNACSTLQRIADLSCSIFLSQLMFGKSSAVLRLDGRLLIRNSILDITSSSLISSRMEEPR